MNGQQSLEFLNGISKSNFEKHVWTTFKNQYENNSVYRSYCDLIHKDPDRVQRIADLPFLPISFFKTHKVQTTKYTDFHFTSSGTTGSSVSKHYVPNLALYEASFRCGFERFYGAINKYAVLALLPSYLERSGSSLIYMVQDWIKNSKHPLSGFYLNDYAALANQLALLEKQKQPTLLIGVSFALLDFAEQYPQQLKHTMVMETGGMKGRRKELLREALHQHLKEGFGQASIHSEYGMTELLSQAYACKDGQFETPPWMQVLARDPSDPLSLIAQGQIGGLNIIDLANQDSCAFIATEDLGRVYASGKFEVLGRFDAAEIRGCNLMVV